MRQLWWGDENDGSYRLRCLWITVDDTDDGGAAMEEGEDMLEEVQRWK